VLEKIKNFLYILTAIACLTCKSGQVTNLKNKSKLNISAFLDLVNVANDKVPVALHIKGLNQDIVTYSIPKIVPGTYQNNNFGKFIEKFQALDNNGQPLPVLKQGDNQWQISNARKLSNITYLVNDTFDSEDSHKVFSPTGSNIVKGENFLLNLYAFIGYLENHKESTYNLYIKHPAEMEASTSLRKLPIENDISNTNSGTEKTDFFRLHRYAVLADSPIMYCKPDILTFMVNDIEVLLSVYSRSPFHRAESIKPQIERVLRAQKNFLGEINTTKYYSILLYLSTGTGDDAKGFGALEHDTSTVVVLPQTLPPKKLEETITNVVSHEFFHIVTPLTIHSEEIHYFDYNNPKMSKHLWLYEGTTEYFSLLFQIQQGLIDKKTFYQKILDKINVAQTFERDYSFTEMSSNILKDPYLQDFRNVYEKGALISMCIDIIIRENSDGVYGILDLIKSLSYSFGSDMPFEDNKLFGIIKKMDADVADFLKLHVEGNTPIDYQYYLNKMGIQYRQTDVPSSFFIHDQQPIIKGKEDTKEIEFAHGVPLNNFLKNLGVRHGDILKRIDQKEYNLKNIYNLFSEPKKWKKGKSITFEIMRKGQPMTLTTKVISPTISKAVLIENPDANENQTKLLRNWIND